MNPARCNNLRDYCLSSTHREGSKACIVWPAFFMVLRVNRELLWSAVQNVLVRQVLGTYRYRSFCSVLGGLDKLTLQQVFLRVSSLFLCQSPSRHWSSLIYHRPLTHTIALTSQHITTFTAFQLDAFLLQNVICSNADISEDLFRMLVSIFRSIHDSSFSVSQLFSVAVYICHCVIMLLPVITVCYRTVWIFIEFL
jgi:hypothetical protein